MKSHERITIRTFDLNKKIHSPRFIKNLRKLTINSWSGMNFELNSFEEKSRQFSKEDLNLQAKAIMAYLDGKPVGWLLLSKEPSKYNFYNHYQGFKNTMGSLVEIYINPTYRRMGIGSRLLEHARHITKDKKLCVCPHDGTSRAFFSNFEKYQYTHM